MQNNILVIGSSNTDMILKCKNIPRPGETVLGGSFSMAAGGKGANQAVAAARAGGNVTFLAKTGKDLFGEKSIEGFIKDKINTNFITMDENNPSGIALIFVDEKGENSIGVASGANLNLKPVDIQLNRDLFKKNKYVLMQLEIPLDSIIEACQIACEIGNIVILNPAPAQKLSENLLKKIDILTPNETEAEILTDIKINSDDDIKKAGSILFEKGIKNVIITLGRNGVFLKNSELEKFIPSFQVKAVDTTAAGDVFNGSLAAFLSKNHSLLDSIKFASAAAAISVTREGAQPSIPPLEEIESFIKAEQI